MKTTLALLLAAVAITGSSNTVSAAITSGSNSTSITQMNYAEMLYDYEVYAGQPRFRWFIIWDLGNGNTYQEGLFLTEQEALNYVAWLYFGGYEPDGVVGYEIVEKEVAPVMEYVATFDKKADAIALADALQNLGLYTDIRRVGLFAMRIR